MKIKDPAYATIVNIKHNNVNFLEILIFLISYIGSVFVPIFLYVVALHIAMFDKMMNTPL